MRIAVLGAGLMGPAIAMDCLENCEVEEVSLIDIDDLRLEEIAASLGKTSKLRTFVQDTTDREGLAKSLIGYDVVCVALPKQLSVEAMWGAVDAATHVVDLSAPQKCLDGINKAAKKAAITIIPGCGLDPGLTEMLAAHGMDMLDSVETINVWCGGIPQEPKPPLNYKILFGGSYLPLQSEAIKIIKEGKLQEVKQYTLAGPVRFEGVKQPLECYYDGFSETLFEVEKFKTVKMCANRTVRYTGYCEKVKFLEECGLLNRQPIEFKGQSIIPFEIFSKVIYAKVRMDKGEEDVTVLRVTVEGIKEGCQTRYTFEMIDFYDEKRGITSMARTTSYTAAIVARMLGRRDITEHGLLSPVKAIRGRRFRRLLEELSERGIKVKNTEGQEGSS